MPIGQILMAILAWLQNVMVKTVIVASWERQNQELELEVGPGLWLASTSVCLARYVISHPGPLHL